MAAVCYSSGGSNTSPYETWAKAVTSFATALAAASSGDTVQVDMENIASGDAEIAGNTTFTIPNGVTVHIGTQSGASGITTGYMGTTYWFGNSTTNRATFFTLTGSARIVGGLTMRTNGNSFLHFNNAAAGSADVDTLLMWQSGSTAASFCRIGADESYSYIENLEVRNDDTTPIAGFSPSSFVEIGNLTFTFAGSLDGAILQSIAGTLATLVVHGGDISSIGSGSAIVGDSTAQTTKVFLDNVILPASYVLIVSQTNANKSAAEITVRDCSSSGSAVPFAYANACGEIRIDTGIYLTAGIAASSWKIVTTANCSPFNPFYSSWLAQHKAAATVEPKFEVLRDGSATAYTDAEFWMESLSKQTASSVKTTLDSTRGTGTNIPAGAGTGSWTGEGGTAWSGEITQGSIVLDSDGYVKSRIGCAVASSTIYVDPGAIG